MSLSCLRQVAWRVKMASNFCTGGRNNTYICNLSGFFVYGRMNTLKTPLVRVVVFENDVDKEKIVVWCELNVVANISN